jgi:hypothetical protein
MPVRKPAQQTKRFPVHGRVQADKSGGRGTGQSAEGSAGECARMVLSRSYQRVPKDPSGFPRSPRSQPQLVTVALRLPSSVTRTDRLHTAEDSLLAANQEDHAWLTCANQLMIRTRKSAQAQTVKR